nr:MAG: hypothetical protein [Apis mellifera filamentous virus]
MLQTRVYAHCEKNCKKKNEPTTQKKQKNIGVQPPNAHRWTYRSPMPASMLAYFNDASMVIQW